ncbi:MAG: hypothetical protein JWP35_4747 [Caulobacter sp.]|nr:hypothetical protein [Caulobacter sp.]
MPAPPKPKAAFSHHGRNSVKHVGVLRGSGVLQDGRRKTPVTYQIDVYEGRNQKNGTGVLYGPIKLAKREDGAPPATLILEDGAPLSVVISGSDEDGVDIETRGDIPGF